MTDAEFHQQELEQQQYLEELEDLQAQNRRIHGKMIGGITFLRDSCISALHREIAIEALFDALAEQEILDKKMRRL